MTLLSICGWIDKTGWGEGPWTNEMDLWWWTDDDTGLDCVIVRHPDHGHLRGYVGVPEGHPLYKTNPDGVEVAVTRQEISCAGSLLPQDAREHLPADGRLLWWFGIAFAGAWDIQPGRRARQIKAGYIPTARELLNHTYADPDRAKNEVEQLAAAITLGASLHRKGAL